SSSGMASRSRADAVGDSPVLPVSYGRRFPLRPSPSRLLVRQFLQPADPFLHLPPWLEGDNQFGGHLHCFPGTRVACRPGLTFLDREDPEIAQLDAPVVQHRLGDSVQDFLHDLLSLDLREAHVRGNRLGQVFLGHELPSVANHHAPTSSRQLCVVARHDLLRGRRFAPSPYPSSTTHDSTNFDCSAATGTVISSLAGSSCWWCVTNSGTARRHPSTSSSSQASGGRS